MSAPSRVVVGTCQMNDVQSGIQAATKRIMAILESDAADSPDIICFPECFLTGYTRDKALAQSRAIDLHGAPFTTFLQQLKAFSQTIILGLIEADRGSLHNTAAVIQNGALLGTYRKNHPNEKIYKPGDELPVFTTKGLTFGVNICNDANYPETAQALAVQGAKIIFYPLNNRLPIDVAKRWRERHIKNLVDRAKQTGCWVVSSDIIANTKTERGYGCSAIMSPSGRVQARVAEQQTGLIHHTVTV